VATQELALAIRVIRACNNFAYRREKLRLVDEGAALQRHTTEQLTKLAEQGKASRADLLLASADVAEAETLRGPANAFYVTAWYDLRRLLGIVDDGLAGVSATLDEITGAPAAELEMEALGRRPEIQALHLAVQEADARLRLEKANRFGNPSLGPGFEYNETSVFFIGGYAYYPIPVLNTRQGEVLQRQAERDRALSALQAMEMQVRQDVQAAQARLANAEKVVDAFRKQTLPALQEARKGIDQLQAQGEPGADVARAVEVRRRLLRAQDLHLDALFELRQARTDLALAIADPSVAFGPVQPQP
jgi:outer membrane protein TolC